MTTQSVPYDLGSIMHYGARAFSSNRQFTIVPVDPNVSPNDLGQRRELSDRDLQHIQALYCGGKFRIMNDLPPKDTQKEQTDKVPICKRARKADFHVNLLQLDVVLEQCYFRCVLASYRCGIYHNLHPVLLRCANILQSSYYAQCATPENNEIFHIRNADLLQTFCNTPYKSVHVGL